LRYFRWISGFLIAVCLLPVLGISVAVAVARLNGCTLHEGFANPCVVMGRDIGSALYSLGVLGWLSLATLPLALGVATVWFAVEIFARVRRRQRRI
jgi:hypothetical protein